MARTGARKVALGLAALVAAAAVVVAERRQKYDEMMADRLFAEYQVNGEQVLSGAFPTSQRFEAFRTDFRARVLTTWERGERQPAHAMFMLDVAIAALNLHSYLHWLDFVALGGKYLRDRTEPPGMSPVMDAFEIAWNKAAIALLEGRRRPDFVADAVTPLKGRMTPAPPANPLPGAVPMLVDPWIKIALGFANEGFVIDDPSTMDTYGIAALNHYQEAAKYPATRAEAVVRSSWLLIKLKRPAEALAALQSFDDAWTTDGVFLYWRRLFGGKALEALGRPDDAIRAYREALAIAPKSQSPRVAMMALEARRNNSRAAEDLAAAIRTAPDPVSDPWWHYAHGDLRFLPARLKALREMSRR